MPHYAIVIEDPEKHKAAAEERQAKARFPLKAPRRAIGDLHTTANSECPLGGINCRNCGDPAFAESCQAAGHCPHCGTRHGIAPESYLAKSGVVLKEVAPPGLDDEWDPAQRTFVKRPGRP